MPDEITVAIHGETQVVARFASLGAETRARLRQALQFLALRLRAAVRTQYDIAGLHVRTGAMKSSVQVLPMEEDAASITARVGIGGGLPYPPIHEYGGTIRPVNAQMLAIPIGEALTGAGVARFGPRDIEAAGYDSSFVVKAEYSHGGQAIIYGKRGGEIVPLFVLVSSVTIPARPFARPALAGMQGEVHRTLAAALVGG